jgi:hypothetical protein
VASTAPGPTTATAGKRPRASRKAVLVVAVIAGLVVVALALAGVSRPDAPTAASAQPEAPAPSVQVTPVQPDGLAATAAASAAAVTDAGAPVPNAVIEKPKQTEKPKQPRVATKKSAPAHVVPPAAASEATASVAREPAAKTVVAEPTTRASAVESNPIPEATVTITGCLETTVQGDRYRLTDTEGADAPKARGWRSGFLKKRPAPVELVGLSDLPNLRKYVGNRVAATGLLTSRELHVRSLESTGPSCN